MEPPSSLSPGKTLWPTLAASPNSSLFLVSLQMNVITFHLSDFPFLKPDFQKGFTGRGTSSPQHWRLSMARRKPADSGYLPTWPDFSRWVDSSQKLTPTSVWILHQGVLLFVVLVCNKQVLGTLCRNRCRYRYTELLNNIRKIQKVIHLCQEIS